MGENSISREEHLDKILSAYRRTPGTAGTIRQPDRLLAAQLHKRGHYCPANDRTTARMSLIIRWLCGIRGLIDLNCESSAVLIRKGLWTDVARENPKFYTFSKYAAT